MKYEEIKQDLFKTEKKYSLGHCVAQDGGLGAGIATQFCKLFGNRLRGITRDANPSNPDVVYYYSNNIPSKGTNITLNLDNPVSTTITPSVSGKWTPN